MPLPLEHSRVRLRPLVEGDLKLIYNWRNKGDYLSLFSSRRNVVSYEQFVAEHKRDTERERHLQFAIERTRDSLMIGWVCDYAYSSIDGFTFFGGYIAAEHRHLGYGAIAGALLIDYLFSFFPIRKIYAEVMSYNQPCLRLVKDMGFKEEGCLRSHRFMFGAYHDQYRLALYRDSLEVINKLLHGRER